MALLPKLPPVPLPGPRAVPLLGADGNLIRFYMDPLRFATRLHRRYGPVAALAANDPAMVSAFEPEHLRQILSDPVNFHNFESIPLRVPEQSPLRRTSRGLTMLNGEIHRRHRRLMMPAFQKAAIDGYRSTIVAVAERSLAHLRPGQTVDVVKEMRELTAHIAVACFFGLDAGPSAERMSALGAELLDKMTSPLVMAFPFDLPGTRFARLSRVFETMERWIGELVREKRARPDGGSDALALMIRARDDDGGTFTDEDLYAEAILLFNAGYETTAYTLAWTLFLLSQHPGVLADLRGELQGVSPGMLTTAEAGSGLPLLDAVIKETMRLLSVTPILIFRFAQQPFRLGSYDLPRGAGVLLCPFLTHRKPELYPEPSRFLPSRWASIRPSSYEYLPFGAGPRTCLGASFASAALRILVPMLLERATFELAPEARVGLRLRAITLGPSGSLPMRLHPPGDLPRRVRVRGDVCELVSFD